MHNVYNENTSTWETRFLRCDALTSVTKIPLDDTVSTDIYAPTFRRQLLLSSSGCKNAPEGGGSRFMWNSDICLPNYKCHVYQTTNVTFYEKSARSICSCSLRESISYHMAETSVYSALQCYSILSNSCIERVRLSILLSVCLSHPVKLSCSCSSLFCLVW
jgi:hypothetical protein